MSNRGVTTNSGAMVDDQVLEEFEATLFPTRSGAVQHDIKWIRRHGWDLDKVPKVTDRADFLQSVETFLSHFTEIEDVRLKVKVAEFDGGTPTRGESRVFFFVVGRDGKGRREWVRVRLGNGHDGAPVAHKFPRRGNAPASLM